MLATCALLRDVQAEPLHALLAGLFSAASLID